MRDRYWLTVWRHGAEWPVEKFYHGDYARKDALKDAATAAEAGHRVRLRKHVDGEWVEVRV